MDNLQVSNNYSTHREDGQICPVDIDTDKETGELKARQKSAPFYAYNKENYKAKVRLAREEPLANSILEFFVSEMDNTNAICVSMATLEKLFKKSRQSISKHIKILEKRQFIEIFKIGNMNAYAVNAFVVFTQGDANLWKAKFTATMYADYDEQNEMVKREYAKQITTKKGR
ncbi:Helix-turn-helix transcriptional regulator [Vibrio crassostreae]|nr:Helix-turn-helix transcriptional regulator [Vibrio crassostreae]CAK2198504.1 Helix-turn-helix transcriptional regulator [Vibrio crassostreae]CAK2897609.1 Helix-turn-helix transcriptional regulator [Vibrio crassostreae]CAK3150183.1 Helix-turn-helix transcriptional regulator [Vibrio crassostreae]